MQKKIISVILAVLMLTVMCFAITACGEKEYEVTFKLACCEVLEPGKKFGPVLEEWIFTKDIEEMHVERPYDGKTYAYISYQYKLWPYPDRQQQWYDQEDKCGIMFNFCQWPLMAGEEEKKYACERGGYLLNVSSAGANKHDYKLKYRSIRLYITIT